MGMPDFKAPFLSHFTHCVPKKLLLEEDHDPLQLWSIPMSPIDNGRSRMIDLFSLPSDPEYPLKCLPQSRNLTAIHGRAKRKRICLLRETRDP
jgi:hypothetical protein